MLPLTNVPTHFISLVHWLLSSISFWSIAHFRHLNICSSLNKRTRAKNKNRKSFLAFFSPLFFCTAQTNHSNANSWAVRLFLHFGHKCLRNLVGRFFVRRCCSTLGSIFKRLASGNDLTWSIIWCNLWKYNDSPLINFGFSKIRQFFFV